MHRSRIIAGVALAATIALTTGSAEAVTAPSADREPVMAATPSSPSWRTTVPAHFRLGLRAGSSSEGEGEGPGRHLDISLRACQTRLWPAGDRTDNLAVRVIGPEFVVLRQVAVYRDSTAAKAAFRELRAAKRGCTLEHHGHQSGTRWRFKQHALGADSLFGSAQARYRGRPTVGLTLVRWVRVGNAIGFTLESGEGMLGTPHSTRHADRQVRDLHRRMCVFKANPCR